MLKKEQSQEDLSKVGEIFAHWTVPERTKYDHGRSWYTWFSVLMFGLLIFALVTLNFLFAVIIILSAVVIFVNDIREPVQIPFYIGEGGILLGRKFFDYKDIRSFWLIYQPSEVKNLYLSPKSFIEPLLSIPLFDQDPLKIRKFLLQYLEEDLEKEEEPVSEQLGRRFKI